MDIIFFCLVGILVAGIIVLISLYGLMTGVLFGGFCAIIIAVYISNEEIFKKETANSTTPAAGQKPAKAQENKEKDQPKRTSEPSDPLKSTATSKSPQATPAAVAEEKHPTNPKLVVPLSLNDDLSAQEKTIQQKLNGVLELIGQLKHQLESGKAESRDGIRNHLRTINEAAITGASQLKMSSELSRLRAALDRIGEESLQNTRLSAGARAKMQGLIASKRKMLERIEKLSAENLKKLSDLDRSCDIWISDFDTLYKIDGLKQASKQLLEELSKLTEVKSIAIPKGMTESQSAFGVVKPVIENPFRSWTTIHGTVVNGRIRSVDRTHVALEDEDGKVVEMPLEWLFLADRNRVSELFSSRSDSSSKSTEMKPPAQASLFFAQKTPDGYLNIRSGPGMEHSIVGRIPSGAGGIVQTGEAIYDKKNQITWLPVRFGTIRGYVSTGFLKPAVEAPIRKPPLLQHAPTKPHMNKSGMMVDALPVYGPSASRSIEAVCVGQKPLISPWERRVPA
jgi:hypothetical protein